MAATERRVCSSRRGMTVLGKVPVVPKPINLPSQRLENRGLFSDVDVVPRGTCWGSTRLFPGASGSKSRKLDAACSTPSQSGGDCDNGGKVETKPISSTSTRNLGVKDGEGSAKATTCQALDKNGKIEVPRTCNSYGVNSLGGQKQETTAPPLQKSGDGYIQGVSGPPGFVHSAPQENQSGLDASGPDRSNGVGAGEFRNATQQDGLPNFADAPHQSAKKEREIIVIHMVGSPAFYGNYPLQLGYPDIYNKNGFHESFPLQFGNFEPYFGFQKHGRLDGGAQISSVSGSDLYDRHEDFVCYEKECYQGRKKSGLVYRNSCESSSYGGAHSEVHEALITPSSLRPRYPSQKDSPRNAGRTRSLYQNGKLVPLEDASVLPVPEKQITLLTKLSQPKMLSLGETRVREFAHAEYVVGSALLACGDEGKAPEPFDEDPAAEDGQGENIATSGLKVANEDRLFKEPEVECKEVSVLKTTCNDTSLHCKAAAALPEGPALKVCQACKKTSVLESARCAVEVKHVIFDADNSSLSTVKGQENASWSHSTEAANDHKQPDDSTLKKKSSAWMNSEGKVKQRLLDKKGVTNGNWKPKRPVGNSKVNFKLFAPKTRKATGRKNTAKTIINDSVSEDSSSTTSNEHPMGNISGDPVNLSSDTESCNKLLELLLPSSLVSSEDVPPDASRDSGEERIKDAKFGNGIVLQGHSKKRKGKNTRKTTLPKDRHDSTATNAVESLVKTVFEDISNTEVQKQEPKDAGSTKEKTWRPKGPTVSQCKSAKASGIQVSKADVAPKKLELQGRELHLHYGSNCSADCSKVAKEQNSAQKSTSLSTSQHCDSEALQPNKSLSSEACSVNARGQQSPAFRKRSAEQAALRHQSTRDASSDKELIGSPATFSNGESGSEHAKQILDSILSSENNLADSNCSLFSSKYHMVRRRVYHVVEGSGGNYTIPSATVPVKSQLAGKKTSSVQTTSSKNQAEFRKKAVKFSSGASYTESEHSEEFSDSMCMVETMSCGFQSKGMCHSGLPANQLPSSSSGIEKNKAKYLKPGERVSAWKPKAKPLSGVLQNFMEKKDDDKSGTPVSTYIEGELKESKDLDNPSQISVSNHLDGGGSCEEQTINIECGLPLESESVWYEPLEEKVHAVSVEDSMPNIESGEVVNFQQKAIIVVSEEEMQLNLALNHGEDVLKGKSLGSANSSENIVPQQSMQTRPEDNPAGNRMPPFKKKNAMSHEKADQYHQMMFKKYKETGQWKPKAGPNSRASNRASRNVSEAHMQDVLVLA